MERDEYTDRYVNPYTDFGFKKLFGTEMNKELLISFINSLLSGKEQIRDLTLTSTPKTSASARQTARLCSTSTARPTAGKRY